MAAPFQVGILGAGCIGSLIASQLVTKLPSLQMLIRPSACHIRQDPQNPAVTNASKVSSPCSIRVIRISQPNSTYQDFSIATRCPSAAESGLSAVLVTTKAQDTLPALRPWIRLGVISSNTAIGLVQNGFGQHEDVIHSDMFSKEWFSAGILLGSTTHGCYMNQSSSSSSVWKDVVHAGQGECHFGIWNPARNPGEENLAQRNMNSLMELLTLLPATYHVPSFRDMEVILLRKLIVNAMINPLTAYYQVQNGELLKNATYASQLTVLSEEIAQIMHRKFPQLTGFHHPVSLFKMAQSVLQTTQQNWSSMYMDVHHRGVNRTEIQYINGTLLKWGKQLHLSCPATEHLVHYFS
jgi:2-dehydropantoate 2-reductase